MDTTVIIVAYKSEHLIEKNINKFHKTNQIIVIDNSQDESLKKNLNLSKKIKLENFGLSDKSAKLKMQSMLKFGYAQTGGSSVVDKNLNDKNFLFFADFKIGDDYIKLTNEKISIKIDVEGHELRVLKGIKNIIKQNQCVLQIEIFSKNYENVNNFLLSFGYKNFYKVNKRSNYFYKNF